MIQKDLAEEYAIKEYKRLVNRAYIVKNNRSFTFDDIKAAFNAGRESTINNIELSWEGGHYSSTIFNIDYKIIYSPVSKEYWIMFGEEWLDLDFSSKNEAKQAADEDYKQRIKRALGL